ncbi:MAG TPA: DUF6531 domain-containing protein, partial [Fimbriimonadaceae bacterium]|nr:DUF6531 domain-containing protein [Fimbriimonadaceae bacterium]
MNGPSFSYRFCATMLCLAVAALGFPLGAFAPVEDSKAEVKQAAGVTSRALTDQEMGSLRGAFGRNPYLVGSPKWNPVYKGVDLYTGTFSLSATDLSFEGGYGIPVNITRSYSSNSQEEGPFGVGWALSADIRTTAGGLLKSSGSPARSVPVSFKERPSAQSDPNLATGSQPASAAVAEDASGQTETIQRDVDGVLTTPPWDKNVIDSEYETVELSGTKYEILKKNTVTTPEGTTYVYEKKGYFDGGVEPFGTSGTAEPSNILKITSVTDRHGNITTYTYGSTYHNFAKRKGTAKEYLLTQVAMPNGHTITLTWGNGTTIPADRLVSVGDGTRDTTYSYDGDGNLETVTTEGGKVTTYAYDPAPFSGSPPTDNPTDLLTSITDCRGLTTTLTYKMLRVFLMPYCVGFGEGDESPCVIKITAPNGLETKFGYYGRTGDGFKFNRHHSSSLLGEFVEADPGNVNATWNSVNVRSRVVDGKMEQYCIFRDTSGNLTHLLWKKIFDVTTQDLEEETSYSSPIYWYDDAIGGDYFPGASTFCKAVKTESDYNFMGNPLRKKTYEYESVTLTSLGDHGENSFPTVSNGSSSHSSEVSYCYWDATKYWQQKATRAGTSGNYRYSYTDYYNSSASVGSKGQVFKVYDDKRTVFDMNSDDIPSGTASDDYWRYRLYPTLQSSLSTHSAKFEYDSKGRPTDVWKIQKTPNLTSPSGWTYVQTQTVYNDSSGWFGMPQTVTEDYGSGKINRVTTTNAYDTAGRATSVTDAANRTFVTAYDSDGRVTSVTRTDTNPDAILVTYTYDTGGGVNNGMVKTIVDKSSYVITSPGGVPTITHSDVTQYFTYHASGVGIGQVSQIEEERTGTEYTTAYEYNGFGERTKATYTTPNGTSRWHYGHYQTVGDPLQGKRAFQRVTKLDGSSNPTSEEFHYYYDSQGRLLYSAFAQDPDDWSPSSGYSYYDSSHHADYRCLATYAYDAAGRLGSLDYTWQTWVPSGETGSYSTTGYIGKTAYEYELSGLNRGLRTQLEVYGPNGGNTAFQLNRVEDYAYDADLDYLASAQYNDNASGGYEQEDSWTYDAAGNRISETRGATTKSNFTYDNLNRMTESPITSGTSYGYYNNILGNRLERDDFTMSTWATYAYDDLNRMTKMVNYGTGGMKNTYRADGMRVEKVTGCSTTYEYDEINDSSYWDENWSVNKPTKRFYYDGQMCMEEDYAADTLNDPVYDMTYYGLGARGIDYIETWVWDPGEFDHVITKKFPLYDGHGNMLATLKRNGTSYTVTDAKSYDVWGSVRSGSGEPFQRYCANLGHV